MIVPAKTKPTLGSVEDDLDRFTARVVASRSTSMSMPLVSLSTVDHDLAKLEQYGKKSATADQSELDALSLFFRDIEDRMFGTIDERLANYRCAYPDSPLFSAATLFGPIEYGRLETAFTRALAWLIDETQPHGFGTAIVNLILEAVGVSTPQRRVCSVELTIPERRTISGKRIDVWAEGTYDDGQRWQLSIEAKIDADESMGQLESYEVMQSGKSEWIGVFLTPTGRDASTSTNVARWRPLSIRILAERLTAFYVTARDAPGSAFLRLFVAGLLRDVLEYPIPLDSRSTDRLKIADLLSGNLF